MNETYYGLKKENAYNHSTSQKGQYTSLCNLPSFALSMSHILLLYTLQTHNTLFRQPIIDQRQQKLEGNVCFCLPTLLLFPALFLCKPKCPSVIIFYLPGELHLSLHSLSVGNEFYQLLSENVLVLSSFLKDILSR